MMQLDNYFESFLLIISIMNKFYEITVKSEKTLRVVVMEVENDSTTVENQVEAQQMQVVCPFL